MAYTRLGYFICLTVDLLEFLNKLFKWCITADFSNLLSVFVEKVRVGKTLYTIRKFLRGVLDIDNCHIVCRKVGNNLLLELVTVATPVHDEEYHTLVATTACYLSQSTR